MSAAARGAGPAGELLVARLGVEMAVSVDAVDADALAFVAEVLQIVRILRVARRDEALAVGQCHRLFDNLPLFEPQDWDRQRQSSCPV